ncbi:DMT family transporter [Motilimonas sp. KMU-193]|uniref:DMT family transporter n=1 Tax=Motilimonas sp. KMU-193 TaxID=3388668 RepID=UPI00396B3499
MTSDPVSPSCFSLSFWLKLGLTLLLFAANSIFCRLALAENLIAAGEFTVIRLSSGAITLVILVWLSQAKAQPQQAGQVRVSWWGAIFLLVYAAGFSFAYLSLGAGLGALILFAWVQITLFVASVVTGVKPTIGQWLGMLLALLGLSVLFLPGSAWPELSAAALMTAAGIAWGAYTLLGKQSGQGNVVWLSRQHFGRAALLSLLLVPWFNWSQPVSGVGILLACLSGVVASALGYALWYSLLTKLTAVQAGLYQLTVPIIASILGVVLLSEAWSWSLTLASAMVLGGIAMAMVSAKTNPSQ